MKHISTFFASFLAPLLMCLSAAHAQSGWFWQNPIPQGNSLGAVTFSDGNTGTAVGYLGTILRTTNGGATWTSQSSGTTNDLLGVSFTDANTGTAVGSSGTIRRTTNGGTTWTGQTSGTSTQLSAVSFSDANNGTAVGGGGTILTSQEGIAWISRIPMTDAALGAIAYGNGRFVAVGGKYDPITGAPLAGTILTSADAIEWDPLQQ